VCQKTAKKGRQGKAPLGSMPKIDVPFKRIAIDLVGPIVPCSERKHRYILTVVDYATRYPEAVALTNIDTITVAEALVDIYSRMGVPEEVLSDNGTQFVSNIMKEVSRLLSIHQIQSSPYHPICNGLVEKMNDTLKTILKKMCSECPKQWDRYLPAVLFAYRSTVQESLGFTPFELMYGRSVRGPMEILKQYWTKESDDREAKIVYQYVIDLKQRLTDTCILAQTELEKSKATQKKYYDRKARSKKLKVGSKVLHLLPIKHNKLLLQWRCPYEVIEKMSELNYKIAVGNKVKNFHVNLLKPYYVREDQEVHAAMVMVLKDGTRYADEEVEDSQELLEVCPLTSTQSWKDVNINENLSKEQQEEIGDLLRLPGHTEVEKHCIYTTSEGTN
jgi:hypothetical protein